MGYVPYDVDGGPTSQEGRQTPRGGGARGEAGTVRSCCPSHADTRGDSSLRYRCEGSYSFLKEAPPDRGRYHASRARTWIDYPFGCPRDFGGRAQLGWTVKRGGPMC